MKLLLFKDNHCDFMTSIGSKKYWLADKMVKLEIFQSGLKRDRLELSGHEISYLKSKTYNAKRPMLMIHGFGGDSLNFVRYARAFGKGRCCLIPDLLGHGQSDRPWDFRYSVEAHAEKLIQLMDKLSFLEFDVVGNSLGGHIALFLAQEYPDRVKSMMLFAPAGLKREKNHWDLDRLKRGQHPLKIFNRADFDQMISNVFVKTPFMPWPMKQVFADYSITNQPLLEKQWLDLRHGSEGNPEMETFLPKMYMPSLIIWGDRDRLLPVKDAEIFSRLMPKVEVHVLENCGHLPMAERPHSMAVLSRVFQNIHKQEIQNGKEFRQC